MEIVSFMFTKHNLELMNELLSYIAEKGHSRILEQLQFNIKYNIFGGYYNLFIKCPSSWDAHYIEQLEKEWRIQHD